MKNYKKNENGVALIITLLVLICMFSSLMILIRSSELGMKVTGNIAVQNKLSGSNEYVTAYALKWLEDNSTSLDNDKTNVGYFSSQPTGTVNYNVADSWVNSYKYNNGSLDSYNNVSELFIIRLCSIANTAPSSNNCITNMGSVLEVNYKIIVKTCQESCASNSKTAKIISETIIRI